MLLTKTVEEAYFYALKLVDIVRHVCGFKEVLLAFSGRRGYSYVHVQDFDAIRLNIEAKREIVNDPTGNTASPYFVPIDPMVTRDMARLIRLPGSLNVRGDYVGMCRVLEIPRVEKIDNYHLQVAPSEYNRVCTVPLLSY
jgi:DNA primase catalytic subunit